MAIQKGILFPVLRIRDNIHIGEFDYHIKAYDQILYSDTIDEGMTFKDICNHIEAVTIENYDKIFNRQMVQTLVDNVAEKYPAAVKGVVPDKVSLVLLQNILAGLVVQKKPIRNLVKIIEILEDEVGNAENINELVDLLMNKLYC